MPLTARQGGNVQYFVCGAVDDVEGVLGNTLQLFGKIGALPSVQRG